MYMYVYLFCFLASLHILTQCHKFTSSIPLPLPPLSPSLSSLTTLSSLPQIFIEFCAGGAVDYIIVGE